MKKAQTKTGKLQRAVLRILEDSAVMTFALLTSSMNSRKVFKTLREYERNRRRDQLSQTVFTLKRRRLVDYHDKNSAIRLTPKGKETAMQHQLDDIRLPRAEKWDRKWRLILFDIPERHGNTRRALSKRLKDLGALQFQRSVFIYPHECRKEINFIINFFKISSYVRYAEASMIESEKSLKAHFEI